MHGNLKPTNLFITKERKVYTSDYFLNEIREIVNPVTAFYYYFSPEQISGKEINYNSDIWSLGCVLYYIFSKSDLFFSKSLLHVISLQQNFKFINLTCPSVYNDIINGTLKYYPKDRMTLREILHLLSNSIIYIKYHFFYFFILDKTEPDEFYDVNRQERAILRIMNNIVANPDDEKLIIVNPSMYLIINIL